MAKEIERKFLLAAPMPANDVIAVTRITQGYIQPDARVTMRIRIEEPMIGDATAIFTLKDKQHGQDPDEEEITIPFYMGMRLLKDCGDCVVKKERYDVIYGHGDQSLKWEVDIFKKKLKGLVVAEIEIKHRQQRIIVPSWLGLEVTDDKRYKNKRLAVAQRLPEGYKKVKGTS